MIKEVKMYTLICDNCGKDVCDGAEYSGWNYQGFVKQIASEEDWIEHEGSDYCPDCYTCDEDDAVILYPSRQQEGDGKNDKL